MVKVVNFLLVFSVVLLGAKELDTRFISVTGTGGISFSPDAVTISLSIKNTNLDLGLSLAKNKKVVEEVLNICKKYKINPKDIKTSHLDMRKEYSYSSYKSDGKGKFLGYSVTQDLEIISRNLNNFEKFSSEILSKEIDQIKGVSLFNSNISKFEDEANLEALLDAQTTAQQLAQKMNVKLGKVIYISDNLTEKPDYAIPLAYIRTKGRANGLVISPGTLSVSKKLQVVFEIK